MKYDNQFAPARIADGPSERTGQALDAKRPYEAPRLVKFGRFERLTLRDEEFGGADNQAYIS